MLFILFEVSIEEVTNEILWVDKSSKEVSLKFFFVIKNEAIARATSDNFEQLFKGVKA